MEKYHRILEKREQISQNQTEISQLEKRKTAVKKIIDNINYRFDGNVNIINKQVEKAIDNLEWGIKGISNSGNVQQLMKVKQKNNDTDTFLSKAKWHLQKEINRCEIEISNVNDSIDSLRYDIDLILYEEQEK